jgi:hypothetical protein
MPPSLAHLESDDSSSTFRDGLTEPHSSLSPSRNEAMRSLKCDKHYQSVVVT